MENLNKEEWKQQLATNNNVVVLDVRTPEEYAEGAQENAKQINFLDTGAFQDYIQNLDNSKTYYVYCRSGARSNGACQMMDKLGLNCNNLLGGMLNWDGKVIQPK